MTAPYVDRPVTDHEAAYAVAAAQAMLWELPTPKLLRHGMNALYLCGDVVLRVGAATAPASVSHELVSWLLDAGVPTVRPVAGYTADLEGYAVTAWERIHEVDHAVDWTSIGRIVRLVHSLPAAEVPAGYPLPDPSTFPWWDFEAMLADVGGEVDGAALDGLAATIERLAGWQDRVRDRPVLCHGDVHPGNVLMSDEGPLLLDWDLLSVANPAWDHAMLTTYADRWGGDPEVYDAFHDGYGRPGVDEGLARQLGELRNVAATLMRVKAGRTSEAAAAEARRRLWYWRGDPDAPTWSAQ